MLFVTQHFHAEAIISRKIDCVQACTRARVCMSVHAHACACGRIYIHKCGYWSRVYAPKCTCMHVCVFTLYTGSEVFFFFFKAHKKLNAMCKFCNVPIGKQCFQVRPMPRHKSQALRSLGQGHCTSRVRNLQRQMPSSGRL